MLRRLTTEELLEKSFLFFTFFPFIQIFPLGTDSQPYALLLAILLLPILAKRKVNKSILFLLLIALFALFVLLISEINFNSIRSISNYASLFFITYAAYLVLKKNRGLSFNFYKFAVIIWFVVGFVQVIIYPNFFTFLLPRGDSLSTLASGRGVVGLAPEPTFYGLVCIFFLLIGYLNFRQEQNIVRYYFILLVQVCLFARSTLVILILLFSFFLYIFIAFCTSREGFIRGIMILFILAISLSVMMDLYVDEYNQLRIAKILTLLMDNPMEVILLDASANERFAHLYFPIYGFFENYGLPHGYSAYESFMEECFANDKLNYWVSDYTMSNGIKRIMSGWGSVFFELGFMGFLLLYVIISNMNKVLNKSFKIVFIFAVVILLANALSFATAIVPFFIGNLIYLHEVAMNHNHKVF